MTIHYHGTPITPKSVLLSLAGGNFCVSFAYPSQVNLCHEIGQSVMLDNGAFTFWRQGKKQNFDKYYKWCENWLKYPTTWAVIPDIIDGTEEQNNKLIDKWPHGARGAPVWHLHESIDRLEWLCYTWNKVCLGSSGEFKSVGTKKWQIRMDDAMNRICKKGYPQTWLHMMRGMAQSKSKYPFASVDSTDIARNHHLANKNAILMKKRWDSMQCTPFWGI